MTRLTPGDLAGLNQNLERYDEELFAKTGRTLRQIACRAAGLDEEHVFRAIEDTAVGVVSVTVGEGLISGFAQAVRDIVGYLGFRAFVPDSVDVAGLAMALEEGADILFMADDARFVALNLRVRRVVDNGEATGRGYGAALEGLANGMAKRHVLVIGAGKVGTGAARILKSMGAHIGVFDSVPARAKRLAQEVGGVVEGDLEQALHEYSMLVDASPASDIIEARHIKSTTLIAAPGIPPGMTAEARVRVENRLIHDPLQIGVATMMISALV